MNKKITIWIAVVVLILVSAGLLISKTELLQGKFSPFKSSIDFTLYSYKGRIVSGVTSPVTSVVVSDVTSESTSEVTSAGGTSEVTSRITSTVPSAVTSPVTSAVAVSKSIAAKKNIANLNELTQELLLSIAQEDYLKDPSKFRLSNSQKQEVIKLYEQKNSL
ncbi:hypothetical protein COW94_00655 [Candidatus Peregrinibacteria bacterium CG22_combo_CG10-13_8_21_14_all_44_10]|nr:MAG: hypothetical protein AUK45_01965 [Candidatus Peregrinibacteria bacterium CG2_30_44_17]PIP66642.1 MAG: hypothetical protein COW94_00655 [Candidatus Peregrinibacteria bacterium CG22_combo_CG10-13_8_21_14_all_44_10]PIS04392.1 MAG: hypothetical protein COT83_00805 [Candidatus Peregrinibacteria bacterium CG10_big_fil_rev_8_21_14_0_10_44_7]PJB89109.1 MAG: hypothetical protein CO082_02170 [Candidatus Peregrinibacteria bacterium CG_4_9_14_0_8_um_filter_44_15]